ncbi:MAG: hydroxyacid dehydrogenase [Elusimicrobiaceae bacterium]|nr:hydroxyacid dehydrogenase [Elusimicrobiaceae bacterium]
MRVLIADKADPICARVFKDRGIEAVVKTGMKPEELKDFLPGFDGIVIRSATTLTPEILKAAKGLKVAARAGIGVDNIDIPAASECGVLVMNTPFGNTVSTAEHAIAMMFALCRMIPAANQSTHAGKWEKNKFEGAEVFEKTLGIVGCGNISSIVADRAKGLRMKVVVFDPVMTDARAEELGVEKVPLDELYQRADIITYHVGLNDKTRGMINKDAIARMKDGVRLINCARGAIMAEEDIKAALESGKLAGIACDVYAKEPAKEHIFFNLPNAVLTPHIAASTVEAQINVARQAAEQISDYLLTGKRANALNGDKIK